MSRVDFFVECLYKILNVDNVEDAQQLLLQSIINDDAIAFYTNQPSAQINLNILDIDDMPFEEMQLENNIQQERTFQSLLDELRMTTEK
ncbi:hypothetical protein SS50377_21053 [Spironucleus salmonicida]|uniref:Uncharacterized protein n=1 Tax=Spironucleus salmonicida TaxID=348837 RepID=V6LJ56_9EUKA|nr:hypothetical protein SS50377_21053 [Spironucleus salmonicida]|eukprot:EST43711.1 Hypothetical protein SS50377_16764 [Spironucleus salmonicida]